MSTDPVANTKKFFKGLRGTENVYTQHEPVIQQLLMDLVKRKFSAEISYPEGFSFSENVILYFVDGFTYEESKCARDVNLSQGANVIIGGNRVWNAEDFIEFIKSK